MTEIYSGPREHHPPPDPANSTYAYIGAFSDELQRAGVHHAIVCPGSRSTPLAVALAQQPGIRVWMHVDERSAAFFGLGMAKRLGQTVVLLCTSGTAAANFLPAVVEAKLTHVPLLVLTADRPPELRDCGAPQAIDQNRLYGTHVKWYMEAALPEATNEALRYIRTLACRAVAQTQAVPAGPVHLNFPFREPLTPEPVIGQPLPPLAHRDPIAWRGRPVNAPYVEVNASSLAAPSAATIACLVTLVHEASHGVIIAGPQDNPALAGPLVRLARHLGYPILADPLSQVRCGGPANEVVLATYDAFLRDEHFVEQATPDLVIRFGAMPTSKPVLLFLKRYNSCPLVVVDAPGGWEEPAQLASRLIHCDSVALCQELLGAVSGHAKEGEWVSKWWQAEMVTRWALRKAIEEFETPFEGRVFTELAQLLPAGATLYIGNSMPVRDLDTFFWGSEHPLRIMGNRGANGIDGVVSSALGVSAVAGTGELTTLVIGDLSFLHDLNGLLAARLHALNLTIVLVNNDGGGIFSFLPQAVCLREPESAESTEYGDKLFEQLFGTPTGLDFSYAVEMYGGKFQRISTWDQFRTAVSRGINTAGINVIEVPTGRESNVVMHRQLWQVTGKALRVLDERTTLARSE